MKFHNITHDDMLNGEGIRVVLWVSGCTHKCDKCQNPLTWDINDGILFEDKAKNEIMQQLDKNYISGITLSGGDPLHIDNRAEITELAKEIHTKYPKKTIWLYSGYTWEQVSNLEVMQYVDVFIDGKFVDELKDTKLHWKGSSNQRTIDVVATLKKGEVVLYDKE